MSCSNMSFEMERWKINFSSSKGFAYDSMSNSTGSEFQMITKFFQKIQLINLDDTYSSREYHISW